MQVVAGCRVQVADCRLHAEGCRVQDAEFRLQDSVMLQVAGCWLSDASRKMLQYAALRLQVAVCGLQITQLYRNQDADAGFRIHDSGCRL